MNKFVDKLTYSISNRRCIERVLSLRYCRDVVIGEYCVLIIVVCREHVSIVVSWRVCSICIRRIARRICSICGRVIVCCVIIVVIVGRCRYRNHWTSTQVCWYLFWFIFYAPFRWPQLVYWREGHVFKLFKFCFVFISSTHVCIFGVVVRSLPLDIFMFYVDVHVSVLVCNMNSFRIY